MNIELKFLRKINIYFQYLCSVNNIKIFDEISKIERSKNELEKSIDKL